MFDDKNLVVNLGLCGESGQKVQVEFGRLKEPVKNLLTYATVTPDSPGKKTDPVDYMYNHSR